MCSGWINILTFIVFIVVQVKKNQKRQQQKSMATTYASCACNAISHSADWGRNGLICFAACHAIAIYDPFISTIGKVTMTLHRHKDRINTVRWIKQRDFKPESEILSSSVDGSAVIWTKKNNSYESKVVLEENSILIFSNSLYISTADLKNDETFSKLLICTGSVDGDLKLCLRDTSGDINYIQTLSFKEKLLIEACFTFLPNTNLPLLAVATGSSTIELFITNSSVIEESQFIKVQILKGHEDWVQCMDFTCDTDNSILLASGSQDAMIRLWKISTNHTEFSTHELHQKEQVFEANDIKYNITLESILYGHERWVYGVDWYPLRSNTKNKNLQLLSCSSDKSMIIWESDKVTGIWSEKVRVGEVGGNLVGFYGCKFSGDGMNILAHGCQGSFHVWAYSEVAKNWIPRSVPSGHFAPVIDLCWEPNGRFLITVSTDQTTRIHAPWNDGKTEFWHEIGRPQVHGYDMSCIVMLTPYMFASGAEEKVVRIFTAPIVFKNSLMQVASVDDFTNVVADSASVPALGLTNKASFNHSINIEANGDFKCDRYTTPTEEDLMQNTLWPELQKLYGHGYEIFSIAAKHDGLLLATACKATSLQHCAIFLWCTKTWSQVQKLLSHQLTVTQMEFSPNDKYLVSVSRDRRWSLFESKDNIYVLIATSLKSGDLHTRIIWCCSWTHDSAFFATGSRDGKIGVWSPNFANKKIVPSTNLDVTTSVTALAFLLHAISEYTYVLAIGYETGCIEIQKMKILNNKYEWQKCLIYKSSEAHHLTVKRLKFRPQKKESIALQLASCGSDHFVKIYNINILELRNL